MMQPDTPTYYPGDRMELEAERSKGFWSRLFGG